MQLLTDHLAQFLCLLGICLSAQAEVSLPNIFGDHMVLQLEQAKPLAMRQDGKGLPLTPFRTDDCSGIIAKHVK